LGLLCVMGFHSLPSIRLYWSKDANFNVSRVSEVMPVKRFLKLFRFLHLNNNSQMPKRGTLNFDPLYKVRPIVTHLNLAFKQVFNPSRFLSIDESMAKFKGRSSLKQYMPMKPIKRGFKVWALCCAKTGFALHLDVYTGRKGKTPEPLGRRVVTDLSSYYSGKGYCFVYNNFFSNVRLVDEMVKKNCFTIATIRSTRKDYPSNLKPEKEMQKGDIDYVQCDNISVSKWRDRGRKSVSVISSIHNASDTSLVKRQNFDGTSRMVQCPKMVSDYNNYMGGVDKFDQMMAYYNCSWKSRRWWMRLFFYYFEAAIVNSYLLYKTTTNLNNNKEKPISHLQFRSILANQLIGSFSSRSKPGFSPTARGPSKKKGAGRMLSVPKSIRSANVGEHLPIKGTSRRCAYCSTIEKPKRSSMTCKKCQVALCLECYDPFHINK